jgi:hypothetical protein
MDKTNPRATAHHENNKLFVPPVQSIATPQPLVRYHKTWQSAYSISGADFKRIFVFPTRPVRSKERSMSLRVTASSFTLI